MPQAVWRAGSGLAVLLGIVAWIAGFLPPQEAGRVGAYRQAASKFDCPKAQLEPEGDKTWMRLLEVDAPPGHAVYAFASTQHNAQAEQWVALLPDTETGEPRYLAPLAGGWIYVITTPAAWPSLARHAIAPPAEGDAKSAGYIHGPEPHWLEPDSLPGLPGDARVCALEWRR